MSTTAADVLIDVIHDWGVDVVFGLPGDGINGIMEALRTRQDEIRFVQVRHEEAAAFMACGYAKLTGKLGVLPRDLRARRHAPAERPLRRQARRAAGAGASPACQFHDLIGTHTQQDVELDKLFEDVAVYNTRIMGPAHVENVADLACRTALAYRGVAHITFPVDMQSMPMKRSERSQRNVPHHTSDARAAAHARPRRRRAARRPPRS